MAKLSVFRERGGEKRREKEEEGTPRHEPLDYSKMRPFQLKQECGKRGLSKQGDKLELRQRLEDYDAGLTDPASPFLTPAKPKAPEPEPEP